MADGFETRAIHEGQPPDPFTGAVVTPITLSSTFVHEEVGRHSGYEYSRSGNPTRRAYEECLASLEGALDGFAFASGMAAEDAVLRLLAPGQRVVIPDDAYGGTFRLVSKVLAPAGIEWTVADLTDLDALERDWPDGAALVWVETPTNPALTIVDIVGLSALAHERGARVVVDNTFATPFLQRPLELGADIVVHSATKYLGGHSDVVGGFVATNDPTIAERLLFLQKSLGAVPGPMDCWLVLRGIKTLAVRMRQHCHSAHALSSFLERHPRVEQTFYPGLPKHPGHAIAAKQMDDFGGMISFLAESEEEATAFVASTKLFKLAESLGGVESLIELPALMTHASTSDAPFAAPRNLIRLSVGLESPDDLLEDLDAAFSKIAGGTH